MVERRPNQPIELHGYFPGLDVLRGLAVGAVVVFHAFANSGFTGRQGSPALFWVELATLGKLGVYLFFVLSGFLITTILLKQRERPGYYRNFYVRRSLRILPAYLLMLVLLKVSGLVHWSFILACLLFVANTAKLVHAHTNEYGVFWTLAVEEQFYLIWPTLVHQWRKPRTLTRVAIGGCAAAFCFRFALQYRGIFTYTWLPTNMDALLYGALCALLITRGVLHQQNVGRAARALLLVGLVFALPYTYLYCFPTAHGRLFWAFFEAVGRLDPFCFFVAAVLMCVQAGSRFRLPYSRFLMFLGYISYGLYLVHPVFFHIYDSLLGNTYLGQFHTRFSLLALRFLLVSVVSIVVATLSRRYYEQLFLRRKKQLAPYAGESRAATEALP